MVLVTVDLTQALVERDLGSVAGGVEELVRNALDADASTVSVHVDEDHLGAVRAVRVVDDGDGMTTGEALRAFGRYRESWKEAARRSPRRGRALLGRRGRGRYDAFAVGDEVVWESVAAAPDGTLVRTTVSGTRSALLVFDVESGPAGEGARTGTIVKIVGTGPRSLALLRPDARVRLAAALGSYLMRHPDARVEFRGAVVDPATVQTRVDDLTVDATVAPGAALRVVEWDTGARPKEAGQGLFLCAPDGRALHEVTEGLPWSDLPWTAYLRSPVFEEHAGVLVFERGAPDPVPAVIDAGVDVLAAHLAGRADTDGARLLASWRDEGTYPYGRPPGNQVERAERAVFDEVALAASPVLRGTDKGGRSLSLRLLREAVEATPSRLGRVLAEVFGLDEDSLAGLNRLLERTSLGAVIASTSLAANRLDSLRGLETMLFDPLSRRQLLEREQLHRFLEDEAWVFGDQYAMTGSEIGLTEVLRRHLKALGRDELLGTRASPVKTADGRSRRLDLMLTRTASAGLGRLDHLVVEIKRPDLVLSGAEVNQIEQYAHAVSHDEQFAGREVRWDFVLVGNRMDSFVLDGVDSDGVRPRVPGKGAYRVRVLTWSRILEDCRQRLEFVRSSLELESGVADGLDYLRRVHPDRLPQALVSGGGGGGGGELGRRGLTPERPRVCLHRGVVHGPRRSVRRSGSPGGSRPAARAARLDAVLSPAVRVSVSRRVPLAMWARSQVVRQRSAVRGRGGPCGLGTLRARCSARSPMVQLTSGLSGARAAASRSRSSCSPRQVTVRGVLPGTARTVAPVVGSVVMSWPVVFWASAGRRPVPRPRLRVASRDLRVSGCGWCVAQASRVSISVLV